MTLEDVTILLCLVQEDERVAEVVEAVAAGREPDSSHRDKEDLLARFDRLLEGDANVSYQV